MTIEDDIALLEQVPTFAVLGREALRVLAIGSESRTLEEGEVLFQEGELADGGYVVEEGVLTALPRGRGARAVHMERGTLIGERSLLVQARRPVTVRATEPASVMRIARPLFLKMLQGYPDAAERLRETMAASADSLAADLRRIRRRLDDGAPPSQN